MNAQIRITTEICSFFGILGEEQIRLEAIAMSHMNEKDRQTYESLQDQAGEGTW